MIRCSVIPTRRILTVIVVGRIRLTPTTANICATIAVPTGLAIGAIIALVGRRLAVQPGPVLRAIEPWHRAALVPAPSLLSPVHNDRYDDSGYDQNCDHYSDCDGCRL